jgi:hypothetical protein
MSIEQTLERIAAALETIAGQIHNAPTVGVEPAPVVEVAAPAAVVIPMPPMPAPAAAPAPTPAIAGGVAPFSDHKGLTDYCMGKYKQLGPIKGGMIQNVLTEMGAANIGQLTADKYVEFFNRCEAL